MPRTATDLFDRYHVQVYRYFLRLTGSADVAQDLTQELFLRVLRHLGSCPAGFETGWIFRIARNLLLDHRRRQQPDRLVALADVRMAGTEATQLLAFGLAEALDLLSEGDRELFLLRELAGLSYAELGRMRNAQPDTIRSRVCRARCRLKELLSPRLSAENRRRNQDE